MSGGRAGGVVHRLHGVRRLAAVTRVRARTRSDGSVVLTTSWSLLCHVVLVWLFFVPVVDRHLITSASSGEVRFFIVSAVFVATALILATCLTLVQRQWRQTYCTRIAP